MMKTLQYIFLVLPSLLIAACSNSDEGGASAQTEVVFMTEVMTRAASSDVLTDFASGDKMHIFASETNSLSDAATSHEAGFNGTTWRTTPTVTIPPGQTRYYFAGYPYDAVNTSPTDLKVSVAKQVDYLYSGSGSKATEENPNVAFKMHHAMAMIAFNIQSYKGGRLTSIKVGNDTFPTEGTLRVTTGKITPTNYGEYTKNCDYILSSTGWTTDHPAIFVIPFAIGAAGMPVELTIDSEVYSIVLPEMRLTLANKYIFYLLHTEQSVMLQADKTETINLMDDTAAITSEPYSFLRVVHSGSSMAAPMLQGENLHGVIYWGDGMQENYAASGVHEYSGQGDKTLTIDAWNASTVVVGSMTDIKEIDFSKF